VPLLANKIAFVTGAGSGIGRAGAIAMAQQGAQVIVSDLDAKKSTQVANEIISKGHNATSYGLDVLDDIALKAIIDETVKTFGNIDILHSHAGYQTEGTLEEVSIEGMDLS
jgi:NAD(P)-dependent dehydrogenase (short-subunit alcohol dehydrogenase family)